MFESTGAFALFDYFRIPYTLVDDEPAASGFASLSVRGQSASLSWPLGSALATERHSPTGYLLGSTPLFGRIA